MALWIAAVNCNPFSVQCPVARAAVVMTRKVKLTVIVDRHGRKGMEMISFCK